MTEKQTYILAAAIIIGGFLLGGRYGYDMTPSSAGQNSISVQAYIYRTNRLTGSVMGCYGRDYCVQIPIDK